MATTLELKLCVSNFSTGTVKQKGYQGKNIEFSRVQLIYFYILFLTDFRQVSKGGWLFKR